MQTPRKGAMSLAGASYATLARENMQGWWGRGCDADARAFSVRVPSGELGRGRLIHFHWLIKICRSAFYE